MENTITELANLLPYPVRDKLRYYLDYVHDRLIDIALEEGKYSLIRDIRNEVDIIFFLRLLYGYFVVGFQNYTQMLDFFGSKEINGFQIGSTEYNSDSRINTEWKQIAQELEKLIDEGNIAQYVKPNISIDTVLRRIIYSLPDEKSNKEQ